MFGEAHWHTGPMKTSKSADVKCPSAVHVWLQQCSRDGYARTLDDNVSDREDMIARTLLCSTHKVDAVAE